MSTTATTTERSQPLPPNADAVEIDLFEGQLADHSVTADLLHDRLPRPHQHRLRATADEADAALWRRRLRDRRGHLLPGLLSVRGSEQPVAGEDRSAQDAAAYHGVMGVDRGGDDVRHDADAILYCALPARRIRGGLLSRHHPLFHLLVSLRPPRAGHCDLHVRDHHRQRDRRTALRRHPQIFRRSERLGRVAMAVPGAGFAGRDTRRHHLLLSAGQAGRCKLVVAGREKPAPAQSGTRRKGYRRRNRKHRSAR